MTTEKKSSISKFILLPLFLFAFIAVKSQNNDYYNEFMARMEAERKYNNFIAWMENYYRRNTTDIVNTQEENRLIYDNFIYSNQIFNRNEYAKNISYYFFAGMFRSDSTKLYGFHGNYLQIKTEENLFVPYLTILMLTNTPTSNKIINNLCQSKANKKEYSKILDKKLLPIDKIQMPDKQEIYFLFMDFFGSGEEAAIKKIISTFTYQNAGIPEMIKLSIVSTELLTAVGCLHPTIEEICKKEIQFYRGAPAEAIIGIVMDINFINKIKFTFSQSSAKYQEATACKKNGNIEKAIEAYEEILKLDSTGTADTGIDGIVYSELGNLYAATGQADKTIEYYDIAIRKNPDNGLLYLRKANIYKLFGNQDKAMETIDALIAQIPQYPFAYYAKGVLYLNQKNYSQALDQFYKYLGTVKIFKPGKEFEIVTLYVKELIKDCNSNLNKEK